MLSTAEKMFYDKLEKKNQYYFVCSRIVKIEQFGLMK